MCNVPMGDDGRLVVPAELGTRAGSDEAADGIVVLTREQLKARVRANLGGLDLVGDLLAERRAASVAEDSG